MNTFGLLLAVFMFLMVLQACYIHLVRPAVMFGVQRRVIAIRDELRMRALEGRIPQDERAFRVLDERLKSRSEHEFSVSISMLLLDKNDPVSSNTAKVKQEILQNSDPSVRELSQDADRVALAALVANSPIWWFVIPILLVLLPISQKAKRIFDRILRYAGDGGSPDGSRRQCVI